MRQATPTGLTLVLVFCLIERYEEHGSWQLPECVSEAERTASAHWGQCIATRADKRAIIRTDTRAAQIVHGRRTSRQAGGAGSKTRTGMQERQADNPHLASSLAVLVPPSMRRVPVTLYTAWPRRSATWRINEELSLAHLCRALAEPPRACTHCTRRAH